jgi:hypothetical protein
MDHHLLCIRGGRGSLEDSRRLHGQVQCQTRRKNKFFYTPLLQSSWAICNVTSVVLSSTASPAIACPPDSTIDIRPTSVRLLFDVRLMSVQLLSNVRSTSVQLSSYVRPTSVQLLFDIRLTFVHRCSSIDVLPSRSVHHYSLSSTHPILQTVRCVRTM